MEVVFALFIQMWSGVTYDSYQMMYNKSEVSLTGHILNKSTHSNNSVILYNVILKFSCFIYSSYVTCHSETIGQINLMAILKPRRGFEMAWPF